MAETVMPGPVCDLSSVRESVCIHTRKIFDSCRDKDCVEDLRFYPTAAAQEVLSASQMIKGGTAELLYVYTDVEPVTFNRGFYSVDMRFYYRVTLQVCTGTPRYTEAEGLCVFDKRCILFGSEGNAKIFSSDTVFDELDVPGRVRTNLPVAVVEAVDPIVLDTRVAEVPPVTAERSCLAEIPSFVAQSFGGEHPMERAWIDFIDNWEVENYRRKVAAGSSKGRVEGKTIIVTGAAQGFGEGIACLLYTSPSPRD